MRMTRSGTEKFDKFVGMMLTQTQYDLALKDALRAQLPLSVFIRHLIARTLTDERAK